jgi:hypothetical protein
MSFLRALSSLMRTREGLSGRSPIAPSQARLTLKFFVMGFWKRSCNLLVRVSLSILLSLGPRCHSSYMVPFKLDFFPLIINLKTKLESMTFYCSLEFGGVCSNGAALKMLPPHHKIKLCRCLFLQVF